MKRILVLLLTFSGLAARAQDAATLVRQVKARLEKVRDYSAAASMLIDVPFINAPSSAVLVFFKSPDRFRVQKPNGISVLPKGGVRVNMASLLAGNQYSIVDAGTARVGTFTTRVVKLLPTDEAAEVVLSTLYIDPAAGVIRRSTVVTRDGGTYEMLLDYGKYTSWGLPDKVTFVFSTKDFKLPKGVTFDYEKSGGKKDPPKGDGKGRVVLTYTGYTINKGVADSVFK
ncbi:LolA family protein [Flaviaesturariibacter terrae]